MQEILESASGSDVALNVVSSSAQRRQKLPVRVLIAVPDVMTGEFVTGTLKSNTLCFITKVIIGSSSIVVREIGTFDPHVTLLSAELEGGPQEGFKVLNEVRCSGAKTAVVMLLNRSNPDGVISALRLGARGIVYRSHSFKSLAKCLQTVHEGQI
jgi:DNA-binding NarL/FixJ family response regulator